MAVIRGIVFDVGDTLARPLSGDWFLCPRFVELLRRAGLAEPSASDLRDALGRGFLFLDGNHYVQTEREEFDQFREYYRIVIGELFPGLQAMDLVAALSEDMVYNVEKLVFYDDVRPVLEDLQGSGYALSVVSNSWPSLETVFIRKGLRRYFGAFVISSQIGSHKPQARIFEHALEVIGIDAPELLFVDDFADNLREAERLGFATLLIDRQGDRCVQKERCIRSLEELAAFL